MKYNTVMTTNIKRFLLTLIILLITAVSAFSGDVFFPTSKGTVLLIANLNSNGRVDNYNRLTVRDTSESGSNMKVVYSIQILDRNRAPVRNTNEREYSVNISDGVLMYPLDNIMDPFFAAKGFKYTMTASNVLIPSTMTAGSRIEDAWMKMIINVPIVGTVTANVAMTDLVCTGVETVTVPAGTFEAYKVAQVTTTTTIGWPSPTIVNRGISWYVKGLGVVKSVNYDSKGRLESASELHELTK